MRDVEEGPVAVVWARPSEVGPVDPTVLAALGEAQLRRAAALTGRRREAFLAGRALIHRVLLDSGGPLAISSRCPTCGGDHGPVRELSGVTLLSVAHADDLVVVAAAPASRGALGVDVELDDARTRRRVADAGALFAADGRADVAGWTRVEAVLKADGRGIALDPLAIDWRWDGGGWRAGVPGGPQHLDVRRAPGPPNAVVSVAVGLS